MTKLHKFAAAGALALALGATFSGFAQARGGGGGGAGGGDAGFAVDAPAIAATVPGGRGQTPATQAREHGCQFEVLRGHFCNIVVRR